MLHQFVRMPTPMAVALAAGLLVQCGARGDEVEMKWSDLTEVTITSSADGTEQPSLYLAPKSSLKEPAPLLVYLHSWSTDYRQDNSDWLREA
ncbi:MAG: hypothetical protein ACKVT0_07565, partial [Planctomycetaceae bacterium]